MPDDLRCCYDGCECTLGEAELQLRMATETGERRAYECGCGAVTVTVREAATERRP